MTHSLISFRATATAPAFDQVLCRPCADVHDWLIYISEAGVADAASSGHNGPCAQCGRVQFGKATDSRPSRCMGEGVPAYWYSDANRLDLLGAYFADTQLRGSVNALFDSVSA